MLHNLKVEISFGEFASHYKYANHFHDFLQTKDNFNVNNVEIETNAKTSSKITFETNTKYLKTILIPEFKLNIENKSLDDQARAYINNSIKFKYKLQQSQLDELRPSDTEGYYISDFTREINAVDPELYK